MDRDEKLARLRELREQKDAAEAEAKALAKELLDELDDLGSVYFLTNEGEKLYAWAEHSTTIEVDLDELRRCVDEGLIPQSVYDEVVDQKVDKAAVKAAVATRRIPSEVVKRTMREVPYRDTVRFSDPNG